MKGTVLIHFLYLTTLKMDPEWQIPRPKLTVGHEVLAYYPSLLSARLMALHRVGGLMRSQARD